jgi:hypothetical protein
MTASGADAKYQDVSCDGRYWGMSGPDADIVELTLMTRRSRSSNGLETSRVLPPAKSIAGGNRAECR